MNIIPIVEPQLVSKLKFAQENGAYIYGCGTYSLRVKEILIKLKIPFSGFLDFSPYDTDKRYVDFPRPQLEKKIVILGFHNYLADIETITSKLYLNNYSVINIVELVLILRNHKIKWSNYWLTTEIELYTDNHEIIADTSKKFADQKSQRIYSNVLKYRQSGDLRYLNERDDLITQYLPVDIPWILNSIDKKNGLTVLDGGAYRGETLDQFCELCSIKKWVFVEPDPLNISFLVEKESQYDFEIEIISKVIHNEIGLVDFEMNENSHASKISFTGEARVETITIDKICEMTKSRLDVIKLDVEGSEIFALQGAIETIQKQKPFLAISTYHLPEHHWEIPKFIAHNFPFYDLYLRVHGEQTFDTVLYCVPRERD